MLFRQKCLFAIMPPYYFGQFCKWQNSPRQELSYTHVFTTNPRVSFVKSFEKNRILLSNVSKPLVLSQSTTFYKLSYFKLHEYSVFSCTKRDYFQVYKHNQDLFPGRKMHFSVACLEVWSKTIIMLLNVNLCINGPTVQKKHRINHCKGRELFWQCTLSA